MVDTIINVSAPLRIMAGKAVFRFTHWSPRHIGLKRTRSLFMVHVINNYFTTNDSNNKLIFVFYFNILKTRHLPG